jgi:hypothetical protein
MKREILMSQLNQKHVSTYEPTSQVQQSECLLNCFQNEMASNAQKLSAAAEFISDAPPGEMTEVLAGTSL